MIIISLFELNQLQSKQMELIFLHSVDLMPWYSQIAALIDLQHKLYIVSLSFYWNCMSMLLHLSSYTAYKLQIDY